MDIWREFTHHNFVIKLSQGSLETDHFKGFILQDYLFLKQYARIYALAAFKSSRLKDMNRAVSLMQELVQVELPMHKAFCQQWGFESDRIEREQPTLELLAYTGFILDRAVSGDLLDLFNVLIPCLVGYAEIGIRLFNDSKTRRLGNPYWSWIELYGGERYRQIVDDGINYFHDLATLYGAELRYAALLSDFRRATTLESAFWSSGNSKRLL